MESGSPWSDEVVARQAELRAFVRRLVADAHLAEDLLQELNLVALAPDRPRVEAPLAWMKGVLRRLFRGELRRGTRRRRRERWVARPLLVESGEASDRAEIERVLAGIELLAEPQRTTLRLRFVEGRTPAQVATRMGVPLRTVHTRTARALARLRRTLAWRGPGDRVRGWLALARPASVCGALAAVTGILWLAAGPETGPPGPCPVLGTRSAGEYELLIFEDVRHATRHALLSDIPHAAPEAGSDAARGERTLALVRPRPAHGR